MPQQNAGRNFVFIIFTNTENQAKRKKIRKAVCFSLQNNWKYTHYVETTHSNEREICDPSCCFLLFLSECSVMSGKCGIPPNSIKLRAVCMHEHAIPPHRTHRHFPENEKGKCVVSKKRHNNKMRKKFFLFCS